MLTDNKPANTISTPITPVYPALLSHIAKAFKASIQPGTHTKDLLEYTDCFPGKQGVVR
jgi:hypothetical protein